MSSQSLKFDNRPKKNDTSSTFVFKSILIGGPAVGKSSLIKRFVYRRFVEGYLATLGVDMSIKELIVNEQKVAVTFFDIGGQIPFKTIATNFSRDAEGVIIVFDIASSNTIDEAREWLQIILESNSSIKSLILIGNKSDLIIKRENAILTKIEAFRNELSKKFGYEIPYFETSAKTGENVDEAFNILIWQLVLKKQNELMRGKYETGNILFDKLLKQLDQDYKSAIETIQGIITDEDEIAEILKPSIVIKLISKLKAKIGTKEKTEAILAILPTLYELIIQHYETSNDFDNYAKLMFEKYELLMQYASGEQLKEKIEAFLLLTLKQFQHPTRIIEWFKMIDAHPRIQEKCIEAKEMYFWLLLQMYNALQLKDPEQLDECEIFARNLENGSNILRDKALETINIIRMWMPDAYISEVEFQPSPINKGEPLLLKIRVKNNTSKKQQFTIQLQASGFETSADKQTKEFGIRGENQFLFMLGKLKEEKTEKPMILIRILDKAQNTVYEGQILVPTITEEKRELVPTINKIIAEQETITFDNNRKTVVLKVEILNPADKNRVVQLAIDAPTFITANNILQPRNLPKTERGKISLISETLILGPPPEPGEYHIHLKLLDENSRTIEGSDKLIIFKYKESAKKKLLKFVQGISMFMPSLF